MRKTRLLGNFLAWITCDHWQNFRRTVFSSSLSLSRARAKSTIRRTQKTNALSSSTGALISEKKNFAARCRKVLFTLPSDASALSECPRNRRKAHFCGSCRVAVMRRKKITHELSCNRKIFVSRYQRALSRLRREHCLSGRLRERGNIASLKPKRSQSEGEREVRVAYVTTRKWKMMREEKKTSTLSYNTARNHAWKKNHR